MTPGGRLHFVSDLLIYYFNEEGAKRKLLNYFTDFTTSHFKKRRYQSYSP